MQTKVIMPQMGESIFEGTITKWLKKVGERVERDEPLFEISTDKVDSEIPAPASGFLNEILISEGQTVQIDTVVAVIGSEAGGEEETIDQVSERAEEPAMAVTATKAAPVKPVSLGEQAPEVPAKQAVSASDRAQGEPVTAGAHPAPPSGLPAGARSRDIRTSPLVRRLARENNIDLAQVRGTGLEGRITKEDIMSYLSRLEKADAREQLASKPASARIESDAESKARVQPVERPQDAASAPSDAHAPGEESVTVPMSQMRRLIAEHMVMSKKTSAHVNTVFEVDMTAIVRLREKSKEEFVKREGIGLTYTPFIAKAVVETVREFPVLNSSVSGDNIIYTKAINLGIAVALENGLIVPVVRNAQLKSFTGLALAIHDLAERARTKKLKPDEVQGGTISITNPGIYGALFATPIINQPQVAILGVGGIEKRPVVVNDAIAIRSMVCLSLSFDHRVIDGAVADQFMAELRNNLQGWSQWRE